MALTFSVSERYLTQSIDLTATPEAVLTNSSTYTRSSLVAAVVAQEVSGSGYARPSLTVASNQVNADGYGVLTYGTITIAASGGDIVFDRIALLADGDWVGWYQSGGTTTITDGNSITVSLVFALGESGAILTGSDGQSAYTVTTADFTQPAVSGTVAVSVEDSSWLAVGGYTYFFDGTNSGFYQVAAIGGVTSVTLTNLGYSGSAAPATVMALGGQLVASGVAGASNLETFTGSPASYTPTQSGVVAIRTDLTPNLPYRTTGTALGNATLIGAYAAFTGLPSAVTPTDTGLFHVRTDLTPNRLYRSTGTALGNLVEVGGASGGCLEGVLVLSMGTSLAIDELGIDSTTFTLSSTLAFSDNGRTDGFDWATNATALVPTGSILLCKGQNSNASAWVRALSVTYSSPLGGVVTLDTGFTVESGTFLDGEPISICVFPSDVGTYSAHTTSFSTSATIPTRYFIDCSGGAVVVTLGTAAAAGQISHLFKVLPTGSGNTVTINRSGSDLVEGVTSLTLVEGDALTLHSDGVSNWWIS